MLHFITVLQYCKGDGVYDSVADTCTYNITANYTKLGESGLPEWDDSDVNFSCMRCYYLDYESSEDVTLTLDGVSHVNPIMYCPYENSTAKFEPSSVEIYYSPVFKLCDVLASVQNIRFISIDHYGTYPAEEDTTVSLNGRRVSSLQEYTSLLILPQAQAKLTIPRLAAESGYIDDLVEDTYKGRSVSGLYITADQPNKYVIQVNSSASLLDYHEGFYSEKRKVNAASPLDDYNRKIALEGAEAGVIASLTGFCALATVGSYIIIKFITRSSSTITPTITAAPGSRCC